MNRNELSTLMRAGLFVLAAWIFWLLIIGPAESKLLIPPYEVELKR